MENTWTPANRDIPDASLCMGCMSPDTGAPVCPYCGWHRASGATSVLHLPPGSMLANSYVVGKVLGQGGFGITYLGYDRQLRRKVAIKEYFPQVIASRMPGGATVTATGVRAQDDFASGLESFLNEGRTLALFGDHPCIVSVLNLFEANQTGYLIMGYLEGMTLAQALGASGGRLPYETAREIMLRVLDGLREVHSQSMLHRDISPDNIYLTRQGPVKILDFGAARITVGERSQSLSVVLKDGYAPEEQYRRNGAQGPWTDIYGVAATLYRTVTGITPQPALDRLADDRLVRPSVYCPNLPPAADAAILKGLALNAMMRYRSVDQFQQDLMAPAGAQPQPIPNPPPQPDPRRQTGQMQAFRQDIPKPGPAIPPPYVPPPYVPPPVVVPPAVTPPGTSARKPRSQAFGIVVGLVLVVVLFAVVMGGRSLLYSHYESEGETNYRNGNYAKAREDFQKAADAGNPVGEMSLGRLYAKGEGATQDFTQARQWYEKAAAHGNTEAMDNLGFLYENGFGVTQDYKEAAKWYRKAADAGNADGMIRLGLLYHDGSGVEQNDEQARQWYEKSADAGSTRGISNLGNLYQEGRGVGRDYEHARKLYDKAIAAGSVAAMTLMGSLYDNGYGVQQDPAQARQWYEKAAMGGDPPAMNTLGDMFGNGRGGPRNTDQQFAWYMKASKTLVPRAVDINLNERRVSQGRATAMLSIGDIYRTQSTPNPTLAREWYEASAAEGNGEAMARMGQLYLDGEGVPKDNGKARQWYEKAASHGSAAAMNDLGLMYTQGRDVDQDYQKGRQWFEKAAEGGNETAMSNLGQMYLQGMGVPADKVKAKQWFEKAANAGSTDGMFYLAVRIEDETDMTNKSPLGRLQAVQQLEVARQWVQKAADLGNLKAKAGLPALDKEIQSLKN